MDLGRHVQLAPGDYPADTLRIHLELDACSCIMENCVMAILPAWLNLTVAKSGHSLDRRCFSAAWAIIFEVECGATDLRAPGRLFARSTSVLHSAPERMRMLCARF